MKKYNYVMMRTPTSSSLNYLPETDVNFSELVKEHDTLFHFLKNVPVKSHSLMSVKNDVIVSKLNQLVVATEKCVILNNFDDNLINHQKLALTAHLSRFYPLDRIHFIEFPALLSTNDILRVEDVYFVSLSEFTNQEGYNQFNAIMTKYSHKTALIENSSNSLQKYLNYVEGNNLIVNPHYEVPSIFKDFNQIVLKEEELNGIGAIWVNDTIILPNNCETLKQTLIDINRYRILSITINAMNQINSYLKDYVILF